MPRRLSNLPDLKPLRRMLRASLTPAEARLWLALQRRQLASRKFRRQHSYGPYVLDFFCPEEMLAIELDGAAHDSAMANEHDQQRDAYLAARGIRVARYENQDVMENLEGVLGDIRERFLNRG